MYDVNTEAIEGFQLSLPQKRLWRMGLSDADGTYCCQCAVEVERDLDAGILAGVLDGLVAKYEILRTRFRRVEGVRLPLQVIADCGEGAYEFRRVDLGGSPSDGDLDQLVRDYHAEERSRGFDLQEGPLFRAALLTTGQGRNVLSLCVHALCADARSLVDLARLAVAGLRADAGRADAADDIVQYVDFAEWLNDLSAPDAAASLWSRRDFADALGACAVLRDGAADAGFAPAAVGRFVDGAAAAAAGRGAADQRAFLLTCWLLLLGRMEGEGRAVAGVAFDGRSYEELEGALGAFTTFIPIPHDFADDATMLDAVDAIRGLCEEAYDQQEYFDWEEVESGGQPATPYCRAAFEFVEATGVAIGTPYVATERFDLKLSCVHGDRGLLTELYYDPHKYSREEAERLLERFGRLAVSAAGGLDRLPYSLPVVGGAERALLASFSGGDPEPREASCVHQLFERQAGRTPDRVALAQEGQLTTYAELNARANKLAHWLREQGVGPEARVGICMERRPEFVVAMLAVLKAGGCYVPLDHAAPDGRLDQILDAAAAAVVLSQGSLRQRFARRRNALLCVDEDWGSVAPFPAHNPDPVGVAGNLAYVLFTSGSTGTPKGVAVEHRQLANYLAGVTRRLSFPAESHCATVSTFAADLGNTVIYPCLCSGGCLHVVPEQYLQDPQGLADYFASRRIDCLKIVPSHLKALMAHPRPDRIMPRKLLVLGGEAFDHDLADALAATGDCETYNHYGPTETTVGVATHHLGSAGARGGAATLPIGRPLPNTRLYILDEHMNHLPVGMAGEIYLGGACLSRGYLQEPGRSGAAYVPDPYTGEAGGRLYRTGDRARFLDDGSVEFLGRLDSQVKIRGHRVEPGEVDAVLKKHPGVREAVTRAGVDPAGNARLWSYVVPDESGAPAVARLLRMRRQGELRDCETCELPNGMAVAQVNAGETEFMYREIFEERVYLRHGITLAPGDCVFDVGANIGLFSLFAQEVCGDLSVYAFEPVPPIFDRLRLNMGIHNPRARLFPCGLSKAAGSAAFDYYPHLSMLSGRYADIGDDGGTVKRFLANERLLGADGGPLDDGLVDEMLRERLITQEYACQLKSLSQVIEECGVERVDLLKVDVQKSEIDVLEGIADRDWPKIRQIVMEVHDTEGRLERVVELLRGRGYAVAVEQEKMLDDTASFDVYASLEPRRPPAAPSGAARWRGAARLCADVRDFAGERLPDYMVPTSVVPLDSLPLTPNGKVDLGRLPDPAGEEEGRGAPVVAARTPVEKQLARIWADVLHQKEIGIDDNFFALGGDSIISIQVISRAQEQGLRITPQDLFKHQTIAELAAVVGDEGPAAVAADQGAVSGRSPMTPVQHWFLEQAARPESHSQAVVLQMRPGVNPDLMRRAWSSLVQHHDALRARFVDGESGWEQTIGEPGEGAAFSLVDISDLEEREQYSAIEEGAIWAQGNLDLEGGSLARAFYFATGDDLPDMFFVLIHLLVADAVSWRILIDDLQTAYGQLQAGSEIRLPAKTVSLRDWAADQARRAGETLDREGQFWRHDGWRAAVPCPRDFAGGDNAMRATRVVSAGIDSEGARRLLEEVPRAVNFQVEEVLLTALAQTLREWRCGGALVELAGHGRGDGTGPDVSRTVGWFATRYPVSLDLCPGLDDLAALRMIKDRLRSLPDGGAGYGVLRYLGPDEIAGELRHLHRPEIGFNYLGKFEEVFRDSPIFAQTTVWRDGGQGDENQGVENSAVEVTSFGSAQLRVAQSLEGTRRYLLQVTGYALEDRLEFNWSYSEDVYRRDTVLSLARRFAANVQRLVDGCIAADVGSSYTPADFPSANLNQEALDELLGDLAGQR